MKRLLFFILGLLLIILIAGAIIGMIAPTSFEMNRTATINKSAEQIWPYVSNLKMMDQWSPWASKDPNMINTFRGNDGQVGSVNYWKGDDDSVGEGEQEIMKLDRNKRVDTELRFKKPREMTNNAYIELKPNGAGTDVTWGLTGDVPFPGNIFFYFMDLDGTVGPDYETGLASLKELVERNP